MPFVKTYCIGTPATPIPLGGTDWQHSGPAPVWGSVIGGSQFVHTAFTTPGVYTCNIWQEDLPGTETQVTIIAKLCGIECNPLCSIRLAWLTVEGGWSSFEFGFAKNAKVSSRRVDGDVRFKRWNAANGDIITHAQMVRDVYVEEKCVSGYLQLQYLPLLEQLRFSVQVYEWSDTINYYNTPVLLDKEDFEIKRCGNGLVYFSFKLIKAKEIQVQTQ